MLLFSSILMSNMFFFSSHPIAFVIIIIIQSLILCISIFSFYHAGWFSLIMFLIFMGGLMVLFIYIASLASNEMFLTNFKSLFSIILLFIFSSIILLKNLPHPLIINNSLNFKLKITPFFSELFFNSTIIVIIYLLLTLIISVNIIKLYNAPIRSIIL
uniref:NADH-ubiquinone oxidoreductase chain 6 n=1 Tax=Thalassaphorura encarpata TaxID=2583954 RepID=A0A6H0EYG6_9HEXA|nr:NADH dehydrogenase subunit 6 [Thalassaphorura encarpata]UFX54048.1 NADH dehydrogenase subunit 6 [Thalassaphorura encarpata]